MEAYTASQSVLSQWSHRISRDWLVHVPAASIAHSSGSTGGHAIRPNSCPLPRQPPWVPTVRLCTAADVEEVAAALGLHRLLVVGSSVGATYALALAALLPDRMQATLLISPSGSTGQRTGRLMIHWTGR